MAALLCTPLRGSPLCSAPGCSFSGAPEPRARSFLGFSFLCLQGGRACLLLVLPAVAVGPFSLSFKTRARNQGVRGKTTHQLSTLHVGLSIPRGGWLCPGQPGSKGRGWEMQPLWGWLDGSWKRRSRVRERDAQRPARPRPRRSLPPPPLPASEVPPRPPQRSCLSAERLLCSLHCLCLYNRFGRWEDGRVRGCPILGFLGGRLPPSGCACLLLPLFRLRS